MHEGISLKDPRPAREGRNAPAPFARRLYAPLAMLLALAALLLLLRPRADFWVQYTRHKQQSIGQLTRAGLPGYSSVLGMGDPSNYMVPTNLCTRACPVTLVDEQDRAWRLSADGYCLQWVYTSEAGAAVNAKNLRTGETIPFFLGNPDDLLTESAQPIRDGLAAGVAPDLLHLFGLDLEVPAFDQGRFRDFAANHLQVESIPREEVGQDVALGNWLELRQTAGFNPCGIFLAGSGAACPQMVLMDKPAYFDDEPASEPYTTAAGIPAVLLWQPEEDGALAKAGLRVYADCGGRGVVQVILPANYLEQAGITTMGQAVACAKSMLDLLVPVGDPG